MENGKTIKELAEEFGVSKQAIRKQLTDDFRENYVQTNTANPSNQLVVTVAGYHILKSHFIKGFDRKPSSNQNEKVGGNAGGNLVTTLEQYNSDLKSEIHSKNEQIKSLQEALNYQQQLLDQQQQLNVDDKQLIQSLRQQLALENSETENATTTESTEEQASKDQRINELESQLQQEKENKQLSTKKWWQFWK
ncbi:DNA-binding protein (plasmid) [Tetragenococcus halophilus]|uniref:DNA-binding protein n=2 Tax=Tetragenococcus TaxID=51668 RepID=A0A3G5FF93_9ENTE|nr:MULTISPECIES: DNA-binding protein [Tetragenococcus]GMA55340.1 hypothetical protein GCM10025857_66970 [Alicyclobacillus contaminans]AYW48979.1 DNA-binding protein [Tetragenococcus osmophilus]AYW49013.1 DNA-binding protein [Tetragenococcus osmophilus]AYW51461.1 DNA-binding protein [Tetragenococcus halophilus]GBD64353.1 hypothetical protein TEHD23766T_1780 [Tetragenococcus halophilus subsp. flandriensis]